MLKKPGLPSKKTEKKSVTFRDQVMRRQSFTDTPLGKHEGHTPNHEPQDTKPPFLDLSVLGAIAESFASCSIEEKNEMETIPGKKPSQPSIFNQYSGELLDDKPSLRHAGEKIPPINPAIKTPRGR